VQRHPYRRLQGQAHQFKTGTACINFGDGDALAVRSLQEVIDHAIRPLAVMSWLALGGTVLIAAMALFLHWAINADALGARQMGLSLSLAWTSAAMLVGSLYAAPFLAALGWRRFSCIGGHGCASSSPPPSRLCRLPC
jgi:hypothetical protein